MIGVFRIIFCYGFTLGILDTWFTVGELSRHLREFLIDKVCFLLVTHLWIQIEHGYDLCVAIVCGQFPCYLDNGTVNLDAKEVFGLPRNTDCGLERYRSVDVRHGSGTDVSVTTPRTAAIPCKVVGGLTVLHDSRYTIVVICSNRFSVLCLLLCLLVLAELVLPVVFL